MTGFDQAIELLRPLFQRGLLRIRPTAERNGNRRHSLNSAMMESEIKEKISEVEMKLSQLGPPRSTDSEMRAYLVSVANQFHTLTTMAIQGNYNDKFFSIPISLHEENLLRGDAKVKKLRSTVQDLDDVLTFVIRLRGVLWRFANPPFETEYGNPEQPARLFPLLLSYEVSASRRISWNDFVRELEEWKTQDRMSNHELAVEILRGHAAIWEIIARTHLQGILYAAKKFAEMLLSYVVGRHSIAFERISQECLRPFFRLRWADLESKLTELVQYYQQGIVQPLHPSFQQPTTAETGSGTADPESNESQEGHVGMDLVARQMINYYDSCMMTFINNVKVLASENCLISQLPNILSAEKLSTMDDETVRHWGAEPDDFSQIHQNLLQDKQCLETTLEDLRFNRTGDGTTIARLYLRLDPEEIGEAARDRSQARRNERNAEAH